MNRCYVCSKVKVVTEQNVCLICNKYYCATHDYYFKRFPYELEKRKSTKWDYMEVVEDFDNCPLCQAVVEQERLERQEDLQNINR